MRPPDRCLLTTRDFSILQSQLERTDLFGNPILPLIRDKLSAAEVVFPEDIDPRVVTLNSRVVFRVNDGPAETRVVVHARENDLIGVTIPILIPRGLALLGMAERQQATPDGPGQPDRIDVVEVAFQPEAARRALGDDVPANQRSDPADARPRPRDPALTSGAIDLAAQRVIRNRAKLRKGPGGSGGPGPSVA